jgi:hypothetical protein
MTRNSSSRTWVERGVAALVLCWLPQCSVAQVEFAVQRYYGMCDASAAVDLGFGRFVVADDERDVLQVYQYGQPQPVASLDLIDYLGNRKANGKSTEADLEGAARIGDRIYWIGSHGRKTRDSSVDEHRWRLFSTQVTATDSGPILRPGPGRPYTGLLASWLVDERYAPLLRQAMNLGPKDAGGLNIEGLASTPEGGLLIGFRNPQIEGRALVAHLLNPNAVLDVHDQPAWGAPILLNLDGRGIRSMEWVGADYRIIAGPSGEAKPQYRPSFALYKWSGQAQTAPVFMQSLPAGFRFEGLFWVEAAQQMMLLSDDGTEVVSGRACNDKKTSANLKSFRSIWLPNKGF